MAKSHDDSQFRTQNLQAGQGESNENFPDNQPEKQPAKLPDEAGQDSATARSQSEDKHESQARKPGDDKPEQGSEATQRARHGSLPKDRDNFIRALLLSEVDESVWRGVYFLDATYREKIWGLIRYFINRNDLPVDHEEIANIWDEVVDAILKMADKAKKGENGELKPKGDLKPLLRNIAWKRSMNHLRERAKAAARLELFKQAKRDEACDATTEKLDILGLDNLIDEIESCYEKLSKHDREILSVGVKLFLEEFEWPSLRDLTEALNALNAKENPSASKLSEKTVKSRLYRVRVSIRSILIGRGTYSER